MTDRELLQQALDVMEAAIKAGDWKVDGACDPDYVLEAIRARLAQPEPEPVAWMYNSTGDTRFAKKLDTPGMHRDESVPLYTTPPRQEEGCAECGKQASEGWALYCVKCSEPLIDGWPLYSGLPQPEPIGWIYEDDEGRILFSQMAPTGMFWEPVYRAAPKREWQGLTDEVIWLEYQRLWPFHPAEEPELAKDIVKFARAIGAKLKEKNT